MAITEFGGTVPSSTDPDNFDSRADAAWAWLVSAVPEMNTAIQLLNLNSVKTISATSHSAALGAKTFTVESGKSFYDGMWVTIADDTDPTKQMVAIVVSYSGTTLQVNVQWHSGFAGSLADWMIVQAPPFNTNAINDEIFLSGSTPTGQTHGSTNTWIRRYATAVINNGGSSMTYADSATLGASITINQTGLYAMSMLEQQSTAVPGISVNSAQLAQSIQTINKSNVVFYGMASGQAIGVVVRLTAGDVIRPHVGGTLNGNEVTSILFRIKRVL